MWNRKLIADFIQITNRIHLHMQKLHHQNSNYNCNQGTWDCLINIMKSANIKIVSSIFSFINSDLSIYSIANPFW